MTRSLGSLKSTWMPTSTLPAWLSKCILTIFLQCHRLNASKHDINVLHHVFTHLDPDIRTEVKYNYSGHLNNIPRDALSQNRVLQKLLVVARQAKVKICSMGNLIYRQTTQAILGNNTDLVVSGEDCTTSAATSAAAASYAASTMLSTSTYGLASQD